MNMCLFQKKILLMSLISFTTSYSYLPLETESEHEKESNEFYQGPSQVEESNATKKRNVNLQKNFNPLQAQLLKNIKEERDQSLSFEERLEQTKKTLKNKLIKNGTTDQLDDEENKVSDLKKMLATNKGPKVLAIFEQWYSLSKENNISIKNALDTSTTDTLFYWCLQKKRSDLFKKMLEVNPEPSSFILASLEKKIDSNCNCSIDPSGEKKINCTEYRNLFNAINNQDSYEEEKSFPLPFKILGFVGFLYFILYSIPELLSKWKKVQK